jgi:hypothetical protein
MSIYCICNSGISGYNCNCSGFHYTCRCNDYGSGNPENRYYANYDTRACPANTFIPTDTCYDSTLEDKLIAKYNEISDSKLIDDIDINLLWDAFLSIITKKNHCRSSVNITPLHEKPGSELLEGKVIKNYHFSNLRNNIEKSGDSKYQGKSAFVDGTGSGFLGDNTIFPDVTVKKFFNGNLIKASDMKDLIKWLIILEKQCICNSNTETVCCSCNIVCDCNY